ncbi:glycosyltransferase family 4 protein [Kutzneria viridogrisea]|uniref:Glycosyltransferase involved in cell wall biosynthesis n=1 Tax=Kutzneria viridogrisea TaxID=47990 RepID=A0ABR6BGN9_9PSEU|nr:glycosyltransferase involved in cell wall biosynthesis [Kutzneria viridogrisea]
MRVLAMLHLYTPHHNAGAEMMTHALLRALVDSGHEVDVLLSRDHHQITDPYTHQGVRVFPHQDNGDPFAWFADPARRPHLVVTHLENTERASILGAQYGVPVVHLAHNTFDDTKWALARQPALVVVNSEWMAEDFTAWWLYEHGATPMPPMLTVHPPVRAEEYATKPGSRVTLINLCLDKGADIFYALAKRFPDRQFLGVAGAYGTQHRLDLPNVEFLDHVPGNEMRDRVYARTKVLLMPSVYESWGRVGIEAACSGIPTIAHPTAGLRESLGDSGTFADRDDIDAWETHLARLLTPRGWSAASRRALARATELDPCTQLAHWVRTAEVLGGSARVAD